MDSTQSAGLLALYAVVEFVKWIWKQNKESSVDRLKDIKDDQKETMRMIRDIATHQETTARLLSDVVAELKSLTHHSFPHKHN